ncbi:MAG TPA: NADH-quinone oxidoreductase subunit L, partial [Tepidisphaeraceae bacterium]|nr:NADH-quinone oxidoreductase subunit L [Tepidisphaeraceae bacterium]
MPLALKYSWLIPLLPLLGALCAGLFGKRFLKGASHLPVWAGIAASAGLAFAILGFVLKTDAKTINDFASIDWFQWINAGSGDFVFNVTAGAWIDSLTAIMLCVVCGIGLLIAIFAAGYMKGEAGYWRFFAYVGLFIFAMTCLVMGNNLIMMYLGWEGVGLCSYLLIGYYNDKAPAREAAKKAFIVNRVGDLGFAIGIILTWYCFKTVSFFGDGVGSTTGFLEMALNPSAYVPTDRQMYLPWIPICLMLGAFGKSAQFPLHVWLPDAMEGPTPVSALIHAATMVTAGVYMCVRLGVMFVTNENSLTIIMIVGVITSVLGATIALRQFDLKKVFAYSTISQLGFMFVAVGVLAPVAAIFHLITHAFFKALLFLSSGVVMHATGGELDMRRMSGLKKDLPITRVVCLIGCLALAGFPIITAGFWSKDEILVASSHRSILVYIIMSATALLTAYYTFRLYFRVFEGPHMMPKHTAHARDSESEHDAHAGAEEHHSHEPFILIAPLVLLAIGALFVGIINLPFDAGVKAHSLGNLLNKSPSVSMAYGYLAGDATMHDGQPITTSLSNAEMSYDVKSEAVHGELAIQFGEHVKDHHPNFIPM